MLLLRDLLDRLGCLVVYSRFMVLVLLVSGFFLYIVRFGSQIVFLYCSTSIVSWLQFWWYLWFGFVFLVTLYI